MTLPAPAASWYAAAPAAIDRYLLPAPALRSKPAAQDRQTYGRTPECYINPAPHSMRAAPITLTLRRKATAKKTIIHTGILALANAF